MQSDKIELLATALNAVQGKLKAAKKDAENPFFKSHYATLGSVWDACRELLHEHGFSVVQGGKVENGQGILTTTLLHKSGQWISGDYPLTAVKSDPQAQGSAVTYARRYCLAAMVGIVTEDDDGESAMSRESPEDRKTIFIPAEVKKYSGISKESGKAYTSYTIVSPDGVSFSTLSEIVARVARDAKERNEQVEITYTQKGKFFNITNIQLVIEDAPE